MKNLKSLYCLSALALVWACGFAQAATRTSSQSGNWNSTSTWGGSAVPGSADLAVIANGHTVTYNLTTTTVAGMTINAGGTLQFDTANSRTLQSTKNVEVRGTLKMRPASASVIHTLKITGANEGNFVGGGDLVLASDVGVWVMGAGKLDILGSTKTGWARASGAIAQGATSVTLGTTPSGWAVGDEVSIAPTGSPIGNNNSHDEFDLRTITAINGATITLNSGTTYAHPMVNGQWTAEVMNLTRNVRIEGMPPTYEFPGSGENNDPGRSHIFIKNTVPTAHTIKYVAIRYMGPREYSGSGTTGSVDVVGRYALHFHYSDNNNDLVVEGVVARNLGSHAFVPHVSHGITFQDCVAYHLADAAYWWDLGKSKDNTNFTTNDTLFNRCVAARIIPEAGVPNHTLEGYLLGIGVGNGITNSVAVGVHGGKNASGYHWPSFANQDDNVWLFEDNMSHNQKSDGAFIWQNDANNHFIQRFVAYRNGKIGIDHGAYSNPYVWEDVSLYNNGDGTSDGSTDQSDMGAEWVQHNISKAAGLEGRWTARDVVVDSAGSQYSALKIIAPAVPAINESLFLRWNVKGYYGEAVTVNQGEGGDWGFYDLVDWTVGAGGELESTDFNLIRMHPDSVIRVQRRNGTAYKITPQSGDPTQFNIVTIPAFYPY